MKRPIPYRLKEVTSSPSTNELQYWRHDTQYGDIQHNDTQHYGKKRDTQHQVSQY